jgi:Flp pilus assembly pilin Flp
MKHSMNDPMNNPIHGGVVAPVIAVQTCWWMLCARVDQRLDARRTDERGQATAEYALVMLGAAAVAVLLIAWATQGGGAGRIGQLLDRVLDAITSRVS